jgi:exopolysaccharide biosynthesis polyprenyl glycosylphosphotransferase
MRNLWTRKLRNVTLTRFGCELFALPTAPKAPQVEPIRQRVKHARPDPPRTSAYDAALPVPREEALRPPAHDRLVNGDSGVAAVADDADHGSPRVAAAEVEANGQLPESAAGAARLPAPWLGPARRRVWGGATVWSVLDGSTWPWIRPAVDLLVTTALTTALVAAERVDGAGLTHAQLLSLYPLLLVAIMGLRGSYSRRLRPSALDAAGSAIVSGSLATAIYVTVTTLAGVDSTQLELVIYVSAAAVAGTAILTAIHLLGQRWAYRTGRISRRTLILGCGAVGSQIAERLRERPEYGLAPVAMLDDASSMTPGALPVGTPDELVEAAAAVHAQHVILAFARAPDRALVEHLRHCEAAGLEVSVVPRFFESMVERVELQRIGALPLMALHNVDPKGWQFGVKYGLERLIGAILIVLLSPLLLLVAAAVRLTSRGPALFRQRRVGLDGQVFDLLKFRSMRVCQDEPGFEVPAGLAPGGVEGKDRRTGVGRFIRRAFLDELPQLFNVVRGEMSLIGPRPERPEFVAQFAGRVKRYGDRHRVRSGITGWAQVNGLRGQTSLAERIELDNYYIDNWSFALDLKIALLTLATVLSVRGKE